MKEDDSQDGDSEEVESDDKEEVAAALLSSLSDELVA